MKRPSVFRFAIAFAAINLGAAQPLSASDHDEKTLLLSDHELSVPITTITINDTVTSAVLDTGSTITVIHDRFVPELGVLPADQTQTRVLGLGGMRLFPMTQVGSIATGGENWSDVTVALHTETEFPVHHSILPISIFESRVVDFDFINDKVFLYDHDPEPVVGNKRSSTLYEDVNGLIFVPVSINGVKGKALIDTGANVSVISPSYARRAGGKTDVLNKKEIQSSDLAVQKVKIQEFRRLRIAEFKITDFAVPVVQTDLFRELGFGEEPMLVIGMDLLSQFRIQIDRGEQRIHFVQRPQFRRPSSNFLKSAF